MTGKPKLLIVDDDADIAREIGLFLARGFDVSRASSIDEAKAMLGDESDAADCGVVVADMRLVGDSKGGIRLAQDLSEQDDRPEVVVLTAYPDFADASECMKAGVFGYVEKGKADTFVKLERECVRAYRHWHLKRIGEIEKSAKPEETPEISKKRQSIFISYSRKDVKFKDELSKFLAPLHRQYDLQAWSDADIPPSADWRQAIREAMERASLAVLLISSNFLASDFCMDVELKEFLRARSDRGLHLVAVLVSDCFWQEIPDIERFQVLPRDATPIKSKASRHRESTWVSIVREIANLLKV